MKIKLNNHSVEQSFFKIIQMHFEGSVLSSIEANGVYSIKITEHGNLRSIRWDYNTVKDRNEDFEVIEKWLILGDMLK